MEYDFHYPIAALMFDPLRIFMQPTDPARYVKCWRRMARARLTDHLSRNSHNPLCVPGVCQLPIPPMSPCILIVEDSVLVAMAIEAALADRGYDTIIAGTLAAAHERLGRKLPVAALLDLHLPDGNSVELARSLHARGSKVAICSGSDSLPDACDFAARFRKPVVASELVEWVEGATRNDAA